MSSFLDATQLASEEKHGRTGTNNVKRRPSRKMLNDLTFLMQHITSKVSEKGSLPAAIAVSSVDEMFKVVEVESHGTAANSSNLQKKWATVAREIRCKSRDERSNGD